MTDETILFIHRTCVFPRKESSHNREVASIPWPNILEIAKLENSIELWWSQKDRGDRSRSSFLITNHKNRANTLQHTPQKDEHPWESQHPSLDLQPSSSSSRTDPLTLNSMATYRTTQSMPLSRWKSLMRRNSESMATGTFILRLRLTIFLFIQWRSPMIWWSLVRERNGRISGGRKNSSGPCVSFSIPNWQIDLTAVSSDWFKHMLPTFFRD